MMTLFPSATFPALLATRAHAAGKSLLQRFLGSSTNMLTGVTPAAAAVGAAVLATQQVSVYIGDLSSSVLGAINPSEITIGVNQDVTEAIAGSTSAVSKAIAQRGGDEETSALVLNVAANTTAVLGATNTSFDGLHATVGIVATTFLGAVNTGTITSGITDTWSPSAAAVWRHPFPPARTT